jgi:hypothetical protein
MCLDQDKMTPNLFSVFQAIHPASPKQTNRQKKKVMGSSAIAWVIVRCRLAERSD